MTENPKKPFQIYLDQDLKDWLHKEAERDGRSASKQIIHFIQEQKAIREHNFKAMQDKAKNEAIISQSK